MTGATILNAPLSRLINTVGLRWWRSGRGVALSLLVGAQATADRGRRGRVVY